MRTGLLTIRGHLQDLNEIPFPKNVRRGDARRRVTLLYGQDQEPMIDVAFEGYDAARNSEDNQEDPGRYPDPQVQFQENGPHPLSNESDHI
jgi:hypothetical protein